MTIPTYTCEACGETYISDWSDEEALAEAQARGFEGPFGVICEQCDKEFMEWARSQGFVP